MVGLEDRSLSLGIRVESPGSNPNDAVRYGGSVYVVRYGGSVYAVRYGGSVYAVRYGGSVYVVRYGCSVYVSALMGAY